MSTTNNHSNPYSTSDIEKYLKGELPAREMHNLEQAALEDPFLADALEGLALHPSLPQDTQPAARSPHPDIADDLRDLRQRLAAKVDEKTRRSGALIIRRRIYIAAVCLLLLGIGFTFYYNTPVHKGSPNDIADNQRPTQATAAAHADSTTSTNSTNTPTTKTTSTNPSTNASTNASANTRANASANTRANASAGTADISSIRPATASTANTLRENALVRPPLAGIPLSKASKTNAKEAKTLAEPAADDKVAITPPATPYTAGTQFQAGTPRPAAVPPAIAGLQITKDSMQLNFKTLGRRQAFSETYLSAAEHPLVYSGKVLDAQNQPLAGASLILNGYSTIRTITDQKGQFRLLLPPQDSTQLLTIAMVGYTQASFVMNSLNLDRQGDNIIHMQPHLSNLDEVVIIGYGAQRKETRAGIRADSDEKLDTLWEKACPVDGRAAYLLYLATTKNKLGLDSAITGTETVSFEVDRNGAVSSFKIEQSLSPAHDAAVIRLISEGPSWRLLKGRRVRAAVSIVF